jgi:hypothetical protein
MTHLPAESPALPLQLTCSSDTRFAATIGKLAGRVASSAADGPHVAAFAEAMSGAVGACFAHLPGEDRPQLRVELSYDAGTVLGCVSWPDTPESAGCAAAVEAAVAALAGQVECGHVDGAVYCRVACHLR